MTNLLQATCLATAIGVVCPVVAAAQQSETLTPARGGQRGARMLASARAFMPAPQGFSVVLVLGEMQGTAAADNVPVAART